MFTPDQRDQAMMKRLKGAQPSAPDIGIEIEAENRDKAIALGKIAEKSISANPLDRYYRYMRKKMKT